TRNMPGNSQRWPNIQTVTGSAGPVICRGGSTRGTRDVPACTDPGWDNGIPARQRAPGCLAPRGLVRTAAPRGGTSRRPSRRTPRPLAPRRHYRAAMDLARLRATELSALYAAGETTPLEVLTAVEQVIDEREPELNALWVRDDPEQVLAQARAATERWRAGTQ